MIFPVGRGFDMREKNEIKKALERNAKDSFGICSCIFWH